MTNRSHRDVCRIISALARQNWERLTKDNNKYSHPIVRDRVFFNAITWVAQEENISPLELTEIIRLYLERAPWNGLLVRDSSALNGNRPGDETWALVRSGGILASFGGSQFQAIYEPAYDIHDKTDLSGKAHQWPPLDDSEYSYPAVKDNEANSDQFSEAYRESIFGMPCGEFNMTFQGMSQESVRTVPDGFRNPLVLNEFANGGPGQEVVAATEHLLRQDAVGSVREWTAKQRNNQGVASSFDILASAALDYQHGRPIVRQLRTWTEDKLASVRDDILMVAAAWPKFLAGNLTFASRSVRSFVVLEQGSDKPLLFERENWPVNVALSRVLEATAKISTMRGMACEFDLSEEGKVIYEGEDDPIIRPLVVNYAPSTEETRSAIEHLTNRLAAIGHDPEAIRSSMSDPLQLGQIIDPKGQLLRKHSGHHEQRLFEMVAAIPKRKQTYFSSVNSNRFSKVGKDPLYRTLGGDGSGDVYLSDGLWLSSNGSISDEGR
jgi:hypothetical protein